MDLITFEDKETLNDSPDIPEKNKLTAENVNEIKKIINELLVNTLEGNETKKAPSVSAVNKALLDIYSTQEKRIGTWVDGKPLYKKTYELTGSDFCLDLYDLDSGLDIDYIEVEKATYRYTNSTGYLITLSNNYYSKENDYFRVFARNNIIRIRKGSEQITNVTEMGTIITIIYTKSTDTV